jgi:hypothetical protein
MHAVQGKVASGIDSVVDSLKVMRQELEIGAAKVAMCEALQVNLQRSMRENADKPGHHQAQRLVFRSDQADGRVVEGLTDVASWGDVVDGWTAAFIPNASRSGATRLTSRT